MERLHLGVALVVGIVHLYYLDGVLKAGRVVELYKETSSSKFIFWLGSCLVELHTQSEEFIAVRNGLGSFLCDFAGSSWVFDFKINNTTIVLSLFLFHLLSECRL